MQPVSRLRGQCRSRPCYQYGPILRNASSAGRHFRCAPLDVRPRGAGAGGRGDVERRQPPAARHRLAGGLSLRWLSIVKRGCRAMSEVGGKAEIICSLSISHFDPKQTSGHHRIPINQSADFSDGTCAWLSSITVNITDLTEFDSPPCEEWLERDVVPYYAKLLARDVCRAMPDLLNKGMCIAVYDEAGAENSPVARASLPRPPPGPCPPPD